MEQYNRYKNIHNKYGENTIFYCNGLFLIEMNKSNPNREIYSLKVDEIDPSDWKIETSSLIEEKRNLEVLVLSYRNKLFNETPQFLKQFDEHFHITALRDGKI